jgi:hypothetical protein
MSFSREFSEWHLTPRGWERGAKVVMFGRPIFGEPPGDRVLSMKWLEDQPYPSDDMKTWLSELWRSPDDEAIRALLDRFGPCPESLQRQAWAGRDRRKLQTSGRRTTL